MSDFDYNNDTDCVLNDRADMQSELHLNSDDDLLMEQIVNNINNTPLGQVLKTIASLPEVRKEKVLNLRSRITKGDYELSDRLDTALDKILEDIIA